MKNYAPNLAGVLAICGWIASALIVTHTGNIPPMLLSSVTSLGGFLVALLYWGAQRQSILGKFRLSAKAYALGTFGICGYTALWLTGLKLAPPFEANALNYMWPLLLVLINARMDRIRLKPGQLAGLMGGLAGSVLLFSRYGVSDLQTSAIPGLLCALAAAFIWALYSNLTRLVSFPSDCVGVFFLITSIVCYGMHLAFEKQPDPLEGANWLWIALLGATRVSYIFWDYAMKHGDRQMLGSVSYLTPALSVLLLGLFGQVEITAMALLGVCFIILGCLAANASNIRNLLRR